ncbi:unnamed protein product [Soboliphyme baturini]|uniref:Gamma-glutamyltranspeptidase 1 n=1 Tax=Soboliphyme baturini TaxID=241478 RepID=A0A183IXU9_9BILA|nr:unnamed protein product [Soboliphyme baturini]
MNTSKRQLGRFPTLLLAITFQLADASCYNIHQPNYESRFACEHSAAGTYSKAAVAADNGVCSDIGADILKRGGNAVDAAIASAFCIGVMDSHSSGIGGGHFTTIYLRKTQQCIAINARETAPAASTPDMFAKDLMSSQYGGKSIGVPGELYGLWLAYRKFGGKVAWRDLVMPTVELCRNGFVVSGALAKALDEVKRYIDSSNSLDVFFNQKTKKIYQAGEILKRPVLGRTLELIANAKDPVQLFYNSGIITAEDFRNYKAKVEATLQMPLGDGLVVCGPYPPSSAVLVMQILNTLQGYEMTPEDLHFNASMVYHIMAEATKFAYSKRAILSDTSFSSTSALIARRIISSKFGRKLRGKITDRSHEPNYYGSFYSRSSSRGTTHISLLDSDGNAVSLTLGSKVRSTKTGIIFNSNMDDFSTPNLTNYFGFLPSPANYIRPGKRPMSSASPLVVYNATDGEVRLVIGSAGGSTIISTVAQVAFMTLQLNQPLELAADRARIHTQVFPAGLQHDPDFSKVRRSFNRLYHSCCKKFFK